MKAKSKQLPIRSILPRIRNLIIITLLIKVSILGLICADYYLVPFSIRNHDINFVYPIGESSTLWSAFKTWDANHYLYLADFSYRPFHMSNAYYPLLPFLIRVVSYLTFNNTLMAGFIISNFLAVLSVVFLYLYIRNTYDEKVAYKSCLILLAFPTSFYIGLIYAESIFLMLSIMLLYYMRENKTAPAFICSFLLPLTRPTGILVIVPALVAIVPSPYSTDRFISKKLLIPTGFLSGYATYLLIMRVYTGDPFAGFTIQNVFLSSNSFLNLLHPVDWFVNNFIFIKFTLNGFTTSILNRAFFVIYAVIAVMSYKKLDKTQYVYLLVTGLIPAMTGNLMSYMRYVVVVFPLYVYIAIKLRERTVYYLLPSSVIQALFLLVHASNRWVA